MKREHGSQKKAKVLVMVKRSPVREEIQERIPAKTVEHLKDTAHIRLKVGNNHLNGHKVVTSDKEAVKAFLPMYALP